MTLDKIMSNPVVTVELDDNLGSVMELFEQGKFKHVLVVEFHKLVGVVSDRDVYRQLTPTFGTSLATYNDQKLLHRPVHTFMTHKPFTLKQTANLFDAVDVLLSKNISCIPIVDSENHIEGIVTKTDMLRLMKANRSKFTE